MANELELVNGVTKRWVGDTKIKYYFPTATITVDVINNSYETVQNNDYANPLTTNFNNITVKYGASTIEEYVDELANQEFFFRVIDPLELESFNNLSDVDKNMYITKLALNNQNELLREILFYIKGIAE